LKFRKRQQFKNAPPLGMVIAGLWEGNVTEPNRVLMRLEWKDYLQQPQVGRSYGVPEVFCVHHGQVWLHPIPDPGGVFQLHYHPPEMMA
jgi:hypothetical protein